MLLLKRSRDNLLYLGNLKDKIVIPKMEHLACFVPGMLALGYQHGMPRDHINIAEGLLYTCYQMYERTITGLSPEEVYFSVEEVGKSLMHRWS